MGVLDKLLRAGEGRKVKALQALVPDINALEPEMETLSDDALQAKTAEFRQRLDNGEDLDDLLIEAFAVIREAAAAHDRPAPLRRAADGRRRAALRLGRRDEDRRGQDPRVDPARVPQRRSAGKGVHLITVNDYLATPRRRVDGPDPPLARASTVGLDHARTTTTPTHKRAQYACDITYGTNNEFGFDYLRDNMAMSQARARSSGATTTRSSTRSTRSSSTRPARR